MKLPEAILKVVDEYGISVVSDKVFFNILLDYNAFDHRPSKAVLKAFLQAGHAEKIKTLLEDDSLPNRLLEFNRLGLQFVQTHGFKETEVTYVMDSFSYGLGWINTPPVEPSSGIVSTSYSICECITVGNVSFNMVYIKGGSFVIGATNEQGTFASFDEKPPVEVTLDGFYIANTLVTQELWKEITGSNPSHFKGGKLPVERVSWFECQKFIQGLNILTHNQFRLPTEAEWEYAARGGATTIQTMYAGCDNADIDKYLWHKGNSGNSSHEVASRRPNSLGLYDMSGNISEWCNDWYFNSYSGYGISSNPTGPNHGTTKVYRGGSWYDSGRFCRVSKRFSMNPSFRNKLVGLRLAATQI